VYYSLPVQPVQILLYVFVGVYFFATLRIMYNTVHYMIKVYDDSTKFWKTTEVNFFVSQYKT